MRVRLKLFTRRKVLLFKEIMVESEMREADRVFRCLPLYLSLSKRRRETHSSLSLSLSVRRCWKKRGGYNGNRVRVFRYIKTLNIEKERALLPGRVSVRVRACLSLFTNEAQADERERLQGRKEGRRPWNVP